MGLELAPEIGPPALAALAGRWPEVDEDVMDHVAGALTRTADAVDTAALQGDQHTQGVLAASTGGLAEGLTGAADPVLGASGSRAATTASQLRDAAAALGGDAAAVRAGKVAVHDTLSGLTERVAQLQAAGPLTAGTATLAVDHEVQAASDAIGGHHQQLLGAVTGPAPSVPVVPGPVLPAPPAAVSPPVSDGPLDALPTTGTVTPTVDAALDAPGPPLDRVLDPAGPGPLPELGAPDAAVADAPVAAAGDPVTAAPPPAGPPPVVPGPPVDGPPSPAGAEPPSAPPPPRLLDLPSPVPGAPVLDHPVLDHPVPDHPGHGTVVPHVPGPAEASRVTAQASAAPVLDPPAAPPSTGGVPTTAPTVPTAPVLDAPSGATPGSVAVGPAPVGPGPVPPSGPGPAASPSSPIAPAPTGGPATGSPPGPVTPSPAPGPGPRPPSAQPPAAGVGAAPTVGVVPGHAPPARPSVPAASTPAPSGAVPVALLLVAFPPGTTPVRSAAPARQLPLRSGEVRPGLCCPPADHPAHRDLPRRTPPPSAAPVGTPLGRTRLLHGWDPLGPLHERELQRRFVVREATADEPAEHAWPPHEQHPEGAASPERREPVLLSAGTVLDRLGSPEGRVVAVAGTPFAARSEPAEHAGAQLRRFRTTVDLPSWETGLLGWFAQPGGGVRHRLTHPVADLLAAGWLEPVTVAGQP